MSGGDAGVPTISVAVGVTVGLLASLVQSLGLTIQRKSHLENEALPISVRKRDHRRPLWLIGFTVFICANVLGTIFQIGALPMLILGPLGAVSLLYNAFFARMILGDKFSINLIAGTALIAGGAVLIGIFGVVPEQTHTLDELIRLYSRPPFLIWISLLSVSIATAVTMAHLTEWAFERRLHQEVPLSPTTPPALGMSSPLYRKRTRRWSTSSRPTFSHSHSSPILATSHRAYGSAESQTRRPQPSDTTDPFSSRSPAVESAGEFPRVTTHILNVTSEMTSAVVEEEEIKEERECLSADAIERTRLVLGVAYGSASGTLSGLCLLFAKTGVELLILTVVGDNQFGRIEAWLIVVVLLVAAILQLFYLNRALRLVGPTLICPLAFCFYNLSSMISGLIYYNQWGMLSGLQIGLVSLGTCILLAGVWIVSIKNNDGATSGLGDGSSEETEGLLLMDPSDDDDSEDESEEQSMDWLPRGLTIGIGAASPGFEIRPAGRRQTLLHHSNLPAIITSRPTSEEIERPPFEVRVPSDGDIEVGAFDFRRRHRDRARGLSMSGAFYVGTRRSSGDFSGATMSAPSSPGVGGDSEGGDESDHENGVRKVGNRKSRLGGSS